MAIYALSQRTTQGTAANAAWEVRAGATTKPRIMELGLTQVAATAGVFGLGRPGAIGVNPTSPQTFVDEGDGAAPAATTTAAVAWSTTAPTVPTNFNRRIALPASVGAGVIWSFPRGLGIPAGGSIVLWVIATAPVCDVYAVVDE